LVLGMGLPTAAAYILVATLTAPALVSMGVDLMAAHMFVFYSAMLSSITPPVALAAFAAAAISRDPPMRVSMVAVKYGFVAFLLPYFFVIEPRLLGEGSLLEIASIFVTSVIGILVLACVIQGQFINRIPLAIRGLLGVAAIALLMPDTTYKITGAAIVVAVLIAKKLAKT